MAIGHPGFFFELALRNESFVKIPIIILLEQVIFIYSLYFIFEEMKVWLYKKETGKLNV